MLCFLIMMDFAYNKDKIIKHLYSLQAPRSLSAVNTIEFRQFVKVGNGRLNNTLNTKRVRL
jgi:hypothetical protein